MRYRHPDGRSELMPIRGARGGGVHKVNVPQGGKIIGITGGITLYPYYIIYGTAITQLSIVILDADNSIRVYGPYGSKMDTGSSTFAIYGDIRSLFGSRSYYLEGLGAFYVTWGGCSDSPCN